MVDGEVIAYSVPSFICALFVLEFGADKFIDHTTVVANRTGIPQGVIALLTAGAEWEEVKSSLLWYASRGADFLLSLPSSSSLLLAIAPPLLWATLSVLRYPISSAPSPSGSYSIEVAMRDFSTKAQRYIPSYFSY